MKIGIITMHRVPNFGSALQAYALQHKLFQHGIDNKIIDYIYSYAGYEPSFIRYIISLLSRLEIIGLKKARIP